MPYMIKAWIPTEAEDPQIYDCMYDAQVDIGEVEDMQPENKYEIVECDKQGKEI